ncbi:MAG: bifunctional heptose 7-phosphate kinase/heptose 1-phosphate adenyltransferase [archaeon]
MIERINKFKDANILVIGDIMLDKYFEGDVLRISPEAPVPVVHIKEEFHEIGGAGNVASNIASLGGKATIFSFVGNDPEAEILKRLLDQKSITYFFDTTSSTIQKTRVVGKGQQLVRFDKEEASEKMFSNEIKNKIIEKANEANIILISDYAKGAITLDLMNLLSNFKNKIIVDAKPKNKELFKGVFLTKSNEKESLTMSSKMNVHEAGQFLNDNLNSNILITRGGKGMVLFSDKTTEIPTYAKEVYDVTGAGDTVIAALALALSVGSSIEEAAIISNHAAGIAVGKKGTYPVSLKELKSKFEYQQMKIVNLDELKRIVEDNKRKGKKIVWTNGCFDLIHIGHVRYMQDAKKLGDILIVGLNSDASVKSLKGQFRPIQSELERAEILSSLEFVDYITIFPESSVEKYLIALKPDIYAKGSDYNLEIMNQDERKAIESYKGETKFIALTEEQSTSKIIKKIKNGI